MIEIIQEQFNISLPDWYIELINNLKNKESIEEIDTNWESLIETNKGAQSEGDVWCFPWKKHYWIIGGDGCGGVYFINTESVDKKICYLDHEDMPENEHDEKFYTESLDDFLESIVNIEKEIQEDYRKLRLRIQNRQWYQFWIPKEIPEYAKEKKQT